MPRPISEPFSMTRPTYGIGAVALGALAAVLRRDARWRETRRIEKLTDAQRDDMGLPHPMPQPRRFEPQGW
ncbi:MAG: hypothetical protein CMP09_27750 [Yangia sp.]|uniref:Uncharacterized protein n=2 Tax=Salipiger thiooxidans TaxID=282683 RepID=A0A1G7M339_9RHOB|nr:hypothetical protein [Salipiger sp.]SDF55590.1 hypothetical protein SAMN04488105_1292 [Salipiger thiooxidans]